MIIDEESLKRRMKTVFRKYQSDTYSIYCPFGPERQTTTIIFVRHVKSVDIDLLLMAHIGPNPLMLSENMALKVSREEPAATKTATKPKESYAFISKNLYIYFQYDKIKQA